MIYRKMVFVTIILIVVFFQTGCTDFSNDSKPLTEENVLETELNEPNLRQLLLNPQEENQKLIKEISRLSKENEQLKKLIDEYNTDVSFFQFDLQEDLILIRENYNVSMDTNISAYVDKYYEYKTNADLTILFNELKRQVISYKGEMLTSFLDEDAFFIQFKLSANQGSRIIWIYTPKYLDEQHIIVIERTVLGQPSPEAFMSRFYLMFIPLDNGETIEVFTHYPLYDHIYQDEDVHPINAFMEIYHKKLGEIENSTDIGITSEETLEFQIKSSESFVEYQIYFPKGKLPTDINIREAYLSNLALSLMTGLIELKIETIIFMEDDKEIAEYHLEDLI